MQTKILTYLIIIAVSLGGGIYLGNNGTVYVKTGDTLRIGATTFELDSITARVIAKLDTFTKPSPIIKWKTRTVDSSRVDTMYVYPNDTVYPARFFMEDMYVKISGMTYYSLHNQNTFDLSYHIKPRTLLLETFWTNRHIENRLSENGVLIPFKSKVDYSEYNNYVESLKPKFWDHWYYTVPATIIIGSGIIYLVK